MQEQRFNDTPSSLKAQSFQNNGDRLHQLKVCVLQPDYSTSTVDYQNYDPHRDISHLVPEAKVDHVNLNKLTTYKQLKELKKKYSSKHAEEQKQYQVEMMKLMQENKANPMMGCLPLIVQLPVFSAVYYAIRQTKEISSASFLWLNLGHPDPYYVLPLLAACMTYIQARVVQTNVPAEQMAQVRMMQLMSPVMVLMFGFASPSGLVLYWLTGSIFMIAQYTVLKKLYRNETASA